MEKRDDGKLKEEIEKFKTRKVFFKYSININPESPSQDITKRIVNKLSEVLEKKLGHFFHIRNTIYSGINISEIISKETNIDGQSYKMCLFWETKLLEESEEIKEMLLNYEVTKEDNSITISNSEISLLEEKLNKDSKIIATNSNKTWGSELDVQIASNNWGLSNHVQENRTDFSNWGMDNKSENSSDPSFNRDNKNRGSFNRNNTILRDGVNKSKGCFNCGEEGHRINECPQPKKIRENNRSMKCFNCQGEGHRSNDCTQPKKARENRCSIKCFNCNEEGHKNSECTKPKKQREYNGPMKCFNCQKEGHKSNECTEPKKPRDQNRENRGPLKCFNCQEEGHKSNDCPQPKISRHFKSNNAFNESKENNVGWNKDHCNESLYKSKLNNKDNDVSSSWNQETKNNHSTNTSEETGGW